MTLVIATVERLWLAFTSTPAPVVLLGAGASMKSGIPMAGDMVEPAGRWAYCRAKGFNPDDPSVRRSDWWPWLQDHSWYDRSKSAADNYPPVVEHLLQPREDRKAFFIRVINIGLAPSPGYEHLADLMGDGLVGTILTTNFDPVLPDCCRRRRRPHHVETIKTPGDYTQFSGAPQYPQIVYVHGSVEHYTDKNLLDEVQRLDDDLVELVVPLLRDHPLVVIGYRGAEPSVMRHLLLDHLRETNNFRHGIYHYFGVILAGVGQ